jgi:hypothetical protein
LTVALLISGSVVRAQGVKDGGQTGPRKLLPRAEEIALARSAAPASASDSATIFVLTAKGYEVGVKGKSGAACYVSRDWIESIEPHCFDPEGAATIMRMSMKRVELLHLGTSKEAADRLIADSLASGHFRLPQRPAMSYMLSAEQELIAPDGRAVGKWRPHLMMYYPYLKASDLGGTADNPVATVVDEGMPTANVMIVIPDFVQVRR